MKKFVLHNENNIPDIKSYKEHFGKYLIIQNVENDFLNDLFNFKLLKRDISQYSIFDIIKDNSVIEDFLMINAASFDYMVFKDKFLIKNNPHLILDGSLFLAKLLNVKRIDIILKDYYLEEKSILIKSIEESEYSNFSLDIKIYIYDESSYYNQYNIRLTPSYLENKKYIFDLESLTQITYLAHIGTFSFKNYGNGEYKGTYILSVTGDIRTPGLYEYKMYTPLKDIINDVGILNRNYNIKCVFTNGFLNPPIDFNTFKKMTLDYECFESLNIRIGNGGMTFIQENICMVRVVLKIIQFAKTVSCGKCMPCHYGFDLAAHYINKMLLGNYIFNDYTELKESIEMIKIGASCLYIRSLANCISVSIEMFRDEFLYLIENKVTLYSFIKE